jgi:hypothetical protein
MLEDTSFAFGANVEPEETSLRTAVVTLSETLTWADIEALRKEQRRDVETVAGGNWGRVVKLLAGLKVPALRTWSQRWVDYCTSGGPRPTRHFGEAGKACRRVELALARLGVIDPDGFEAREAPRARPSKARVQRRRQQRGGDCNGLREYNERMRGPWIG